MHKSGCGGTGVETTSNMHLKHMLLLSIAPAALAVGYTSPAHATACADTGFGVSDVEVVVEPATDCLVVTAEVEASGCDDVVIVSIQNNCQAPLVLQSGDLQCEPTAQEIEDNGGIADPVDCSTLPAGRIGTTQFDVLAAGSQERELAGTLDADEEGGEPTSVVIRLDYEVAESDRNAGDGCSVSAANRVGSAGASSAGLLFGAVCVGVAAAIRRSTTGRCRRI